MTQTLLLILCWPKWFQPIMISDTYLNGANCIGNVISVSGLQYFTSIHFFYFSPLHFKCNYICHHLNGFNAWSKLYFSSKWTEIVFFLPEASFGLRVLSLPACVCVCVCVSVNNKLVGAIIHQPFKLGSPNLDQRCKRPWLRALLFSGAIDLDLQGQIKL